ncbi:transcription termination/antitermination protein NusG [Alphaproteobacteria bacterium]|nr:transcription termination/antitermination protein NusG [Alphaproteobacteria bacterium]
MEMKPRWYVVHVYSGSEDRVAKLIREKAESKGLDDKLFEIVIPAEEVVEIKSGERVNVDKKCFPGYVLIKMDLTDDLWHLIRSVPRVSGILGAKNKPTPISEQDVEKIMKQVRDSKDKPKSTFVFEVGDQVKVIDGPFSSFSGYVEEIEEDKQKLKVSIVIFGRATPVALDYVQVERV